MDSIAVRNVNQLPSDEKQSLESLVGGHLEEHQQVFIMAFTPFVAPGQEARSEATAGLKKTWAKVDDHLLQHGVSENEFNEAVDEAVKNLRHRQD